MSTSPLRRRAKQEEERESPEVAPFSSSDHRPTTQTRHNADASAGTQKAGKAAGIISGLDVLRLVTTFVALALSLSYYLTSGDSLTFNRRPWFTHLDRLRAYALSVYNGTTVPRDPIYLSINGTIFDVSASPHTYGPGGSYHVFAGRDATRAFVTGCFQTDLTGDLRGVERMFIPVEDEDAEEDGEVAADGKQRKERREGEEGEGRTVTSTTTKAQKKIRAEQEKREARKRVQKEVEKWLRFYGEHAKYFEVGRLVVDVDADAAEGTVGHGEGKGQGMRKEDVRYEGEIPALCEAAEKARPRRSQLNAAAAAGDGKDKSVLRTKKTGRQQEGTKPV